MLSLVPYKRSTSIVPNSVDPLGRFFDDVLSSWSFFDRYVTDMSIHRTHIVDGKLQLEVDLPGLKAEDITLCSDDGRLVVSGKIRGNEFRYAFALDQAYDIESAEASMDAGVLSISFLPVTKPTSKKIAITVKK